MTLSPHKVLAKLAGHQRSRAEEALAAMAAKRHEFLARRHEAELCLDKLKMQRDVALSGGTQASMLMMMESAIQEQHDRITAIGAALAEIEQEEKRLIAGWIEASRKNKVHEKMQMASDKKDRRIRERREQQQLDDMCAARKSGERGN